MHSTHGGKAHLVSMSGLARSLVSNLRLDKPPYSAGCASGGPIPEDKGSATNEERRALLACFALSAMVGLAMKYDPMRWSAQVEEACHQLTQDEENEGDKALVYMARISRLSVSTAEISRRALEDPEFGRHAILNVGSLKAALEQLKGTIPSKLSDHSTIAAYLCSVEVGIYELALYHHPAPPSTFTNSLSSSGPEVESRRIAYLTTLLLVCQSYIELFLTSDIIYITAPTMLVFPYCLKIAYKLQTLKIPAWDPALSKAVLDPVRCLERAAQAAEVGNETLKVRTGEDSVFKAMAETLRKSAPIWRVNGDVEQEVGMERDTGMQDVAVEPAHLSGNVGELNGSWMDANFSSDFWLSGSFDF